MYTYVAAFHGLLAILGIGFCIGEKLRSDFDILMSGVNASIKRNISYTHLYEKTKITIFKKIRNIYIYIYNLHLV